MTKNQVKKSVHGEHKKRQMKKKDKIVNKLKDKLKSAILEQASSAAESLIAEAKTQKATSKSYIPSASSSGDFKAKKKQKTTNLKNKKGKPSKSNAPKAHENDKQNGQKHFNIMKKTVQKTKNESVNGDRKESSENVNGFKTDEPPKKNKNKKKKNKSKQTVDQKPAKPTESVPEPRKSTDEQQNVDKPKRKVDDVKVNKGKGKKRLKTVGGFVESNANDKKETKRVTEKLKKKQKKSKLAQQPESAEDAPQIKVFNVTEKNKSEGNSDSEGDSYIDKFFNGDDNDVDENHISSLDESETKHKNGFSAKASGKSNETSEIPPKPSKKNKKKLSDEKKSSPNSTNSSPKNKLVSYKKPAEGSRGHDELKWPDEDDSISFSDSDLMYGSDSEISLGSEMIDSDDTYECDSTDVESMDEYEDDMSYDEYEQHTSDSEYGDSECESASSGDTYDDFMNSRHYDDGHSSNDHEYSDSAYDDLRIAQGTAVSHKITDKRIELFENDTESRIMEVPKSDSDNESCVELIPINVNKTKFWREVKQKIAEKAFKLKEQQAKEDAKRMAYEKSIADYYAMDNLVNANPTKVNDNTDDSVSIVKCPKNFNHSTLDWLQFCDDKRQSQEDTILVYPKTNSKKINVISIPDPHERKTTAIKSNVKTNKNENNSFENRMETESEYDVTDDDNSSVAETDDSEQQSNASVAQFFNSVNSRHVLLLLRKTLHFHGSLHIKLIAGGAIAFGYELQLNKTVTVHSPRGHGLICLIPHPNEAASQPNLKVLDSLKDDFYSQDLNYLKDEFNSASDAILLLERDQTNKGVNMIERYMRETMFPNINAFNNESPFYSSEFVLHCKFLNEPDKGLVLNDEWLTLNLKNDTKLITIGGKGVGKSTFVRYLINSNINKFKKFLFIDLDIGQPELFVPQTLSVTVVDEPILGPGYLRNVKPAKSVLFGDINVLPDPIKYWRCVAEIYKFCSTNSEFSNIPWVINTMGYSRGFGSELIACILKIFKTTDMVQIQSRMAKENFDQIMKADVVNNFKLNVFKDEMKQITENCRHKTHIFHAARGKGNQVDMNAKDIRYTMILAKLGNCLKSNSDWLTSVKPVEASLNDLSVLVASGEEINPSDYLNLLNGNLVYLCEKRPENATDIVDCHGIGIVRSVDASTNKLYLLATIPLSDLRNVNVLAIGTIPLPSAVFLNQHSQICGTVPYVYNSDKFVGSKQVPKHIFRAEGNRKNKPIQLMEE